jgi:hypothetical protein
LNSGIGVTDSISVRTSRRSRSSTGPLGSISSSERRGIASTSDFALTVRAPLSSRIRSAIVPSGSTSNASSRCPRLIVPPASSNGPAIVNGTDWAPPWIAL